MARILVTGGSGFIGTNLVGSLRQRGLEVMNYDCKPPADTTQHTQYLMGNIMDAPSILSATRDFQPDFVIHLAARCDLNGATLDEYAANTIGVKNVIAAIRATKSVRRVIFASSRYVHATSIQPKRDDEYSPFTAYGASKVEGEKIVRASNLEIPWLLIRPTSIWGPWFDVPYRNFFDAVRRGLYMHPRGQHLFKSYGYVGNVVHQILGFVNAPEQAVHGRVFYVSDDQNIEIRQFAELIRRAFNAPPIRQIPFSLLRGMALAGDVLKTMGMANPPLTSFRLENLMTPMHYDMSATVALVGHSPYTLDHGVAETVKWMHAPG